MLYQRTQAAASRSTSPIAPGAGVAGARLVVDEFCFVQGVQRFGQGVIVGVTGRTHRRYCLATGESLPIAHVAVLDASVGVVHEPTSVYIIAATLVDRHVQRVQGHVGMQRGRNFPAQDFTRAHVGDEGDVDPASLGWHVGDVRNPQLVEIMGPEMPIDQVQGACMARC